MNGMMLIGKLKGFEKFTEVGGIYVVKNLKLYCYSSSNRFYIPENNKFIVLALRNNDNKLKIYFQGKIAFVSEKRYGEDDAEMDIVRIT